jgi:hypothetical protein
MQYPLQIVSACVWKNAERIKDALLGSGISLPSNVDLHLREDGRR